MPAVALAGRVPGLASKSCDSRKRMNIPIDGFMEFSFHIGKEERKHLSAAGEEPAERIPPPPSLRKRHQTPLASAGAMHYQKAANVFY
ncbi:hypothetical protein [Mesorhizobium silamurunense]|uniref:hypothetical protein n=1 Tax=Mesorhizobium silamurunense TaxID=499528 RepID=UPI0017803688|nr:hypothetical protein [Mesorhizobium silamurunense]